MESNQAPSSQRVLRFTKSNREFRYALTSQDYLDLCRAVEHEGPPKLGVAWTLIQRFAMLYPLYRDLSTFVKAYAQPINPQWFPDGKRHLDELQKLASDTAAVQRENSDAAKRIKYANQSLDSISSDTKRVVSSIFAGASSPIPLSSHYAAPITRTSIQAAEKARNAFADKRNYTVFPYGDILSSNWFYGESGMAGVKVRAILEVASSTAIALLAIVVTTGTGYLALHLLRRFMT